MAYNQWMMELLVQFNSQFEFLSNFLTNEVTSTHPAQRNKLCPRIHYTKQREREKKKKKKKKGPGSKGQVKAKIKL